MSILLSLLAFLPNTRIVLFEIARNVPFTIPGNSSCKSGEFYLQFRGIPLYKKHVLDLGCGTGRDVYIASKLVGESGCAIGVDMTDEQIGTAIKYQEEQRERFGFKKTNVKFLKGYIEDLASLGIEDNSVDVVISNLPI